MRAWHLTGAPSRLSATLIQSTRIPWTTWTCCKTKCWWDLLSWLLTQFLPCACMLRGQAACLICRSAVHQQPVVGLQASSIVVQKAYTRDIFDGAKPDKIEDFKAEFPHVTYEEFAHITSVVRRLLQLYRLLWPNADRSCFAPTLRTSTLFCTHYDCERQALHTHADCVVRLPLSWQR